MPDYRLTINMRDVTERDATELAQEIMNEYGGDYDAGRGEFDIGVSRVEGTSTYIVDFIPE